MDTSEVEKMIAGLNSHLPAMRRTLAEYSESGDLTYRTRDGKILEIERSEIDYLLSVCTEIEKVQLRLPIFITTDISGDTSAWKVDGRTEAKVVSKILGKPLIREDSIRFYHPDYRELMKKLPNSMTVLYMP